MADRVLAYIGGASAVVLALALAITYAFYTGQVGVLRIRLAEAQSARDAANENIGSLKGGLAQCNAGVDALKTASDAKTAQANDALAAATKISGNLRQSAQALLEARPGEDVCVSARNLILERTR